MTPSLLISVGFLWILFFWFYRSYRIDRFRYNLFVLRDELFEMARSGVIKFDDPAYRILRLTLNGTIRFAHRYNLIDLLTFFVFKPIRPDGESYSAKWDAAIVSYDAKVQQRLRNMQTKMHFYILEQMVLTSALAAFTVVLFALWLIMSMAKAYTFKMIKSVLNTARLAETMSRLDSLAFLGATQKYHC